MGYWGFGWPGWQFISYRVDLPLFIVDSTVLPLLDTFSVAFSMLGIIIGTEWDC